MRPVKVSEEQTQRFISETAFWSVENGKLHREYIFENFVQAFGFMKEVAIFAEEINHHPEWFNVYKKVVVDLTTHEADGITALDFGLAKKMDEIASSCQPG